ncbi:hypothetical protein TNCT_35731 [Trichonephila clavata]|uniref:Uncharacterized protein n=1 Tax=Trichonephila clavata TaxID=2740835 RepID=A0A8X6LID7_TRICU|nr:hypothetical protein TNCT_35731 [Trichonephila clavata]
MSWSTSTDNFGNFFETVKYLILLLKMSKYVPFMIVPKITQACSGIAAMVLFGYLWKADLQAGKNIEERQKMRLKQTSSQS